MSFDLVLFGGTGDLASRKLLPSLFQAFRHGSLPQKARIIGVSPRELDDQQYRRLIRGRMGECEPEKRPCADDEFDRFAALLHFLRMDLSRPDDYPLLARSLRERMPTSSSCTWPRHRRCSKWPAARSAPPG